MSIISTYNHPKRIQKVYPSSFFMPDSYIETEAARSSQHLDPSTPTMWGPPSDVCWFINLHNYSYLRTINHSYWSYWHQLNAILGAPHCNTSKFFDRSHPETMELTSLRRWRSSLTSCLISPRPTWTRCRHWRKNAFFLHLHVQ